MSKKSNRRTFLKTAAVAGAGLVILKSGILKAGQSPNEKLGMAIIGVGGRGAANLKAVQGERIVALCDVNEEILKKAAQQFPEAKTYVDWRKCLDQKDIDAVVCSTTDHTHAFINIWAMNRGKHVYCEKPLANSVHEARMVRETYLKNKDRLATQMGTQVHATENFRRVVELIRGGAIGMPQEVRVWCSRMPEGGSYLPPAGDPPPYLHWDLWIGPSPMHPYNPGYLGGCLKWNRFWDFGSGQIGDMGSHLIDLAYWALDLRFPTTCQAKGSPLSPDTCPQWLMAEWEHPANDWRGPVKVYWYDGGKKPGMPSKIFHREGMFQGLIFRGEMGYLLADYGYRLLMPTKGDMTHYRSPKPEDLIPPSPGHHEEWIKACKGDKKTTCNFDYSGALIEHNLLALVSYRAGKDGTMTETLGPDASTKGEKAATQQVPCCIGPKIEWDAENLKIKNCPQAEVFVQKKYREGWVLNG